jgi:hypothetical protein
MENHGSKQLGPALLATCFTLVSCLTYSLTLKIEATCSSETMIDFQQTTWCYTLEDRTLQVGPDGFPLINVLIVHVQFASPLSPYKPLSVVSSHWQYLKWFTKVLEHHHVL